MLASKLYARAITTESFFFFPCSLFFSASPFSISRAPGLGRTYICMYIYASDDDDDEDVAELRSKKASQMGGT